MAKKFNIMNQIMPKPPKTLYSSKVVNFKIPKVVSTKAKSLKLK